MSQQEQIAEAILGKDAEDFFASDLGRYIMGRADQEKEAALAELANTSPWRIFKGFELRSIILRAQSMRAWLTELVINGKHAERMMEYGSADDNAGI